MNFIERVGNKVPHPFTLFIGLFLVLAVVSTIVSLFNVSVNVPGGKTLAIRGAFTAEGISHMVGGAVEAFVTFPALGPVLVVALGIGVAQGTGALEALMRVAFRRVPARYVPYVVALVACQGHVFSDSAYVILPVLAAVVFKAVGRNPLAGLIGAYACVGTSYNGGLMLGTLDVSTVGLTQAAANLLPQIDGYTIHVAHNYFFTAANGLILPLVGGFIIDKVLEPRLPKPTHDPRGDDEGLLNSVTPLQSRALAIAGIATFAWVAALLVAWLIPGSPLQGEEGQLAPSPFVESLSLVLSSVFLVFGLVYARTARIDPKKRGAYPHMVESIRELSGFIVLVFVISQTLALLSWSNLATLMARKFADTAEHLNIDGFWILLLIVVITSFLNLFITSGSSLWSLLSSVFVPAAMLLGLSPAAAQAAFRIGDSVTGALTPMQVFLYFTLVAAQKYRPDIKLGTLITRLIPFAVAFFVVWTGILVVFYIFDLPLGPGAPIHLPAQ